MTDQYIKMRSVELASALPNVGKDNVIETSERIYRFISGYNTDEHAKTFFSIFGIAD
jgi:ribonuclease HII